ncbi:MAG: MauE/DoxX family redox-associated membrane protein [Luminiphilus sp.]|jgi:uncharacterized membrane protein|nr:MauE/DoxX family redox-associated membrane protein [Luminiphilus sp.]MDG1460218.1 MauE/DoxX family redox-associated membrane protein [Luminiphilus sp.]MDG2443547.1 MauE/DoxX family redox-associated membrane protein [Luminiphilus sp.]
MLVSVVMGAIAVFACVIFFHAGYSKCRHSADYIDIMAVYLGRPVKGWAVTAVGTTEMALALLLLVPATGPIAALCCSFLLVMYAGFMWRQIQVGRKDLRCGCSGPAAETRIGPELVLRNLLVAAPLLGMASLSPSLNSWVGISLGIALGLFLVLIYLSTDQIIANRQRLVGWSQ